MRAEAMMRRSMLVLLVLAALAVPALGEAQRLVLPAGSPLVISSKNDINSGDVQTGDLVEFTVHDAVSVKGVPVVAASAPARGVVVYSRHARIAGRGELMVEVQDVQAVDGSWIPIRVRSASTGGLAALVPQEDMDLTGATFPRGRNGLLSSGRVLDAWTTEEAAFLVTPQGPTAAPLAPRHGAKGSPVKLVAGTPVHIHPTDAISSGSVQVGDQVAFTTSEAVTVNGKTVIESGAGAQGTVLMVVESAMANHGGELVLGIDSVQGVDGQAIPLRSTDASKGRGNHALSFALGRIVPLVGLAVSGRQAVVPPDQQFVVSVARDRLVMVP